MGWSGAMWAIAQELIGDKVVDIIFRFIPGFGQADEVRDAIKAAKNGDWLEFISEVGQMVVQNKPLLIESAIYRYLSKKNEMKQLIYVFLGLSLFSCTDEKAGAELLALQKEMAAAQTELEALQAEVTAAPGMIHNVFFWLKEGISEADEAAFLAGVNSLRKIETIGKCFVGPPAATEERGVIDNTYSYALLVHFDDVEGQNAYQVDPIHLKFVEDHKDKWTKVIVYDNEVQ